ncbi:MAG TPA: hypothetical protein VM687_09440 [Stenotrophomonas sp.]|nr:hypothetical protein [Stenotrophomonas sp.]
MKLKWVLGVGLIVGAAVATFSISRLHDDARYGPLHCDVCSIAAPLADKPTQAFIERWIAAQGLAAHNRFLGIGAGGRIIVCNALACTTYRRTNSGGWDGIEQQPIQSLGVSAR